MYLSSWWHYVDCQSQSIEHAGYRRDILRRNPKRYDEDGEELASSDEDEEADIQAAAENPYSDIKLESEFPISSLIQGNVCSHRMITGLLMPLVSAASLPDHPSMSIAYTSSTLTDMAQHASEMVQRERKCLASAKQLLTNFRGDGSWIPCGQFYDPKDEKMFETTHLHPNVTSTKASSNANGFGGDREIVDGSTSNENFLDASGRSKPDEYPAFSEVLVSEILSESTGKGKQAEKSASANGGSQADFIPKVASTQEVHLQAKKDAEVEAMESTDGYAGETTAAQCEEDDEEILQNDIVAIVGDDVSATREREPEDAVKDPDGHLRMNAERAAGKAAASVSGSTHGPDTREDEEDGIMEDGADSRAAPRRMRTRAQAQVASEPYLSSRADTPETIPPDIHPLFKVPEAAVPDKNYGLPPQESEETRRLLTVFVQKQEEVVRSTEKLFNSLTEAALARKEVFSWCKAEGHLGDMSDGEDWYDKEEWGLEGDLIKGRNEDEEDKEPPGKKTRGRRA